MSSLQKVYLDNHCFEVEIADTFLKKAIGLSFRKKLDKNKGMLFVFKKDQVISIWMFGVQIPLDIVWINDNNKVVHIEKNVQPCRGLICPVVFSKKSARYVLEINAGIIDNPSKMR